MLSHGYSGPPPYPSRNQMEQREHKIQDTVDHKAASLEKKYEDVSKKLKQKEEEVQSLKDKLAVESSLAIRTGKTESLNNPVSQTRLKEMYDDLRCRWPKIKRHLKSNKESPEPTKEGIMMAFEKGKEKVDKLKASIENCITLRESNNAMSEKVTQHKLSAFQDIQLALYYGAKNNNDIKISVQKDSKKLKGVQTKDLIEDLHSECCWLGQMMALNNPPLQPDWTNHVPGMDAWHILPRNFISFQQYFM